MAFNIQNFLSEDVIKAMDFVFELYSEEPDASDVDLGVTVFSAGGSPVGVVRCVTKDKMTVEAIFLSDSLTVKATVVDTDGMEYVIPFHTFNSITEEAMLPTDGESENVLDPFCLGPVTIREAVSNCYGRWPELVLK